MKYPVIACKDKTEISILSKLAAASFFDEYDAILTIEDPMESEPLRIKSQFNIPQEILEFHDVVIARHGREKACRHDDIEKAIAFIERQRGKKIAIHCHAGISRSSAISIVAVCYLNSSKTPDEIEADIKSVFEIFPHIDPNKRIVEMGDMALDLEAELVMAFYKHQEKLPKEKVSAKNIW